VNNNIKPMNNSHNLIEIGSYKGKVLLSLLDGSKRFKEIARTANVHDALVVRALTEFLKKGWVIKTEDGLYSLTEDGRRVAEITSKEARLYSLFEKAKTIDPDLLEAVLELYLWLKRLDNLLIENKQFVEEREVIELVRDAVRKLGTERIKKNIEEILRSMD